MITLNNLNNKPNKNCKFSGSRLTRLKTWFEIKIKSISTKTCCTIIGIVLPLSVNMAFVKLVLVNMAFVELAFVNMAFVTIVFVTMAFVNMAFVTMVFVGVKKQAK